MEAFEKIILSAVDEKLAEQHRKIDKIEEGVKNLIGENIALKEEKKQILAQIKKVRFHYSEHDGVWEALTKIIDTHS